MSDRQHPVLEIQGLCKHYQQHGSFLQGLFGQADTVRAVDGVDLELHRGETLGVVGESGCGKTTLGRSLLRLVEPTEGSVRYHRDEQDGTREIELTDLPDSELRELRTDLQYIFQDPFRSLNPRMTVGDIVGEPIEAHGIARGERRDDRVRELLETVGLSPSHAYRYPHEFSGGQRQRIGIARALAVDPAVIVCDEPVSALDVSVQAQILNLLADLQAEFDLSYIFIAHDLSVVEHIADRVAVMYLGEIVEVAPTEQLFSSPKHPYTEALLSVIPEPDPRWSGDKILLEGEVPSPLDPPSGCRFHTRCHRIIPAAEYDLSQETWTGLRSLKLRAEEATSVDELISLGRDGRLVDADALGRAELDEQIRSAFGLPFRLSDTRAEKHLEEALTALQNRGTEAAASTLDEQFVSPCETLNPETTEAEPSQEVSCLLYDFERGELPDTAGEDGTS